MLRSVVAAITVSSFTWTFTMAEAPGQSTLDVSYVHPQETVASVETRVHDLSKAIAAHVESSDYAANVAREAAIQTLFAGFDSGGGIVH